MNLSEIRDGLAERLGIVFERVHRTIPMSINPPAVFIALGEGTLDEDFDGAVTVNWSVNVVLTRDDVRGQERLDEYLSSDTNDSITAVVYEDSTLGGTVDSTRVTGWGEPITLELGGTSYIGVVVNVETLGA